MTYGLPPTITDNTVTLTWGTAGQYFGYCTISDVIYEMPQYATYNSLSGNAGRSLMAEAISTAAMVDMEAMIRPAYQLPYSGTDGGVLYILRIINRKLAAAGLFERQLQGVEPSLSATAAQLRHDAEMLVHDILSGAIDWTTVSDLTGNSRKPVTNRAVGATVVPNPSMDSTAATPIFAIGGRTRFRPDDNF